MIPIFLRYWQALPWLCFSPFTLRSIRYEALRQYDVSEEAKRQNDVLKEDGVQFVGDILAAGYWSARISEISQEDTVLIIGAGLPQKQGSIYPRGYMLLVYG